MVSIASWCFASYTIGYKWEEDVDDDGGDEEDRVALGNGDEWSQFVAVLQPNAYVWWRQFHGLCNNFLNSCSQEIVKLLLILGFLMVMCMHAFTNHHKTV